MIQRTYQVIRFALRRRYSLSGTRCLIPLLPYTRAADVRKAHEFKSMPEMYQTADCDDRQDWPHEAGMPEVRRCRPLEYRRGQVGRKQPRKTRASETIGRLAAWERIN
jgi:hypothetical protein